MNVRNLKKKSETDWARIDKMTDDEIDTSDIPPLDDEFFKSAKWILPRWAIDLGDFRQAKEFAGHILKRKWEKEETPGKRLEHQAFNTSLIVSYARPFHDNKNGAPPKSSLGKQIAKVLDETEIELHRRILKLRDTVFAHPEASGNPLDQPRYSQFIPMHVVDNLNESEVTLLNRMIEKWVDLLEVERSEFKRRLAEAT